MEATAKIIRIKEGLMMAYKYLYLIILTFFTAWAEDKKFVIIIPSHNNVTWHKKNLDSIFAQNYQNYRVVYIDDGSTDGTSNYVDQHVQKNNMSNKLTIISNNSRNLLKNYYTIICSCNDEEIVLIVDGKDWLAHNQVLSFLNNVYQNKDVWATYGQFEYYPRDPNAKMQELCGNLGFTTYYPNIVIKDKNFRKWPYLITQPVTFYAKLFKKINEKDFIRTEHFDEIQWDMIFMFPILEMCGDKFEAITNNVLYICNYTDELRNSPKAKKERRNNFASDIRKIEKYSTRKII